MVIYHIISRLCVQLKTVVYIYTCLQLGILDVKLTSVSLDPHQEYEKKVRNFFLIFKINGIVQCLYNLTDCSLYVDDFIICLRSKSM